MQNIKPPWLLIAGGGNRNVQALNIIHNDLQECWSFVTKLLSIFFGSLIDHRHYPISLNQSGGRQSFLPFPPPTAHSVSCE